MEALVLAICLQNQGGCSDGAENYLRYRPEVQDNLKRYERMFNERIGSAALVVALAGGKIAFRENNRLYNLEYGLTGGTLKVRWNF